MPHLMLLKDMDAEILERRVVPSDVDIETELVNEQARWSDEGWEVDRPNSGGLPAMYFFIQRGDVRRIVHLVLDSGYRDMERSPG